MKRVRIRKIMIFLALAMAIALTLGMLTACDLTAGKDDDNATVPAVPEEDNALHDDFFDMLWGEDWQQSADDLPESGDIELSQYAAKFYALGAAEVPAEIKKGGDIYFHTSIAGNFGLRGKDGSSLEAELGFEIEAILDRTSKNADGELTSENSAIGVRVYSGAATVMGAYFFIDDPTSLYFDFAGNHIRLSAEFVHDGELINDAFGKAIGRALGKECEFEFGNIDIKYSLNSILDGVLEAANGRWSPLSVLKAFAGALGYDPELIEAPDEYEVELIRQLFSGWLKAEKHGNDYKIGMDTTAGGSLAHTLFNKALGLDLIFNMNFSEENGRLKDGVYFELALPGLLTNDGRYPYAELRVNAFEFAPADGRKVETAADREQYSADISIKEEESLSPSGVTLFGAELKTIKLTRAFRLDLVNPIETNKTMLDLRLSYGDDTVLGASFEGGTLTFEVDPTVLFKEDTLLGKACKAIADFIYENLLEEDEELARKMADKIYIGGADGDRAALNPEFTGMSISGISVRQIVDDYVDSVFEAHDLFEKMLEDGADRLPDFEAPDFDFEAPDFGDFGGFGDFGKGDSKFPSMSAFNLAGIMRGRILPALGELLSTVKTLEDGKICVRCDSVTQMLLDVCNKLDGLEGADAYTLGQLIDEVVDGTLKALDFLASEGIITYDEQAPFARALADACFEKLTSFVTLEGAPTYEEARDILLSIGAITEADDSYYTEYALYLMLASTSVELNVDVNDGIRYTVSVGVFEAGVTYSYSVTTC